MEMKRMNKQIERLNDGFSRMEKMMQRIDFSFPQATVESPFSLMSNANPVSERGGDVELSEINPLVRNVEGEQATFWIQYSIDDI